MMRKVLCAMAVTAVLGFGSAAQAANVTIGTADTGIDPAGLLAEGVTQFAPAYLAAISVGLGFTIVAGVIGIIYSVLRRRRTA